MDLNAPATADNLAEIAEWANDDITVYDVLTGAWQEWTGADYPNP